jgi:hypothetical protein
MTGVNLLLKNGGSIYRRARHSSAAGLVLGRRGLSTETSKRISSSLKNMMKPFFLKCHPDVQTSHTSKQVNMEALQTLNGFMDSLDATCDGKLVDWPSTLPIEFLLMTEEVTARKKKSIETITRRKVEIVVPPVSIRDKIVQSVGPERQIFIQKLQTAVQQEFAKILHLAGLPLPQGIKAQRQEEDFWDNVIDKEILDRRDSTLGRRFATDERPKTKYEESRDRFIRSFDQKKFNKMYNEAVNDLEAHFATNGLIQNNIKFKLDLVNKVISKVRIDKDADIGTLDQLITLRRLSLILEDNFEHLHMEEFGRMWEDLTIILCKPRTFGTSDSALNKRRKRGQESGFRFTYGADERVTIHVPIDFRDEELLAELNRNLRDWFSIIDVDAEDCFRYTL